MLSAAELRRRRRALSRVIGPEGIAILPAASEQLRNRDVHHPFRQDSDFLYLTGFPEPDAWAVIAPRHPEGDFVLFCRPRDAEREQWDGTRIGIEGAVARFGADRAHPLDALDEQLPALLENRSQLHYAIGEQEALDARVMGWVRQVRARARTGVCAPDTFIALGRSLHELRLRKSRTELSLMRRAARISAGAHRALMRHCRPGLNEADLEALFLYECARAGARHQAYPPIVAGGAHACTLHYTANDAELREGDLVLIDAGCELAGYASDITRTFPVSGRFSAPQRRLYELVLEAQRAAIAAVGPGASVNAPHEAALRVLTQGLIRLGILAGSLGKLIEDEAYKPYYMHRTGHWLGLDVHDVGVARDARGEWRTLEPGMVLTIEPGLYMPADAAVPLEYQGIGIRIEDDVVVTDAGCRVLSEEAPKDPDAIEALMTRPG